MSLFCLNSQSNAQQKKDNAEAKIIVAYFSCITEIGCRINTYTNK